MEVDVIILHKDSNESELQLGMKREVVEVFEKLYENVQDESFQVTLKGEQRIIKYHLSSKNENMIFVKFACDDTPVRAAYTLDCVINRLLRGEHRKEWSIVQAYDEVSQLFCCKLMPLFGLFERRTRELVYITVVKTFGVEWFDKSFSESLKNSLKGKAKGNKTALVENALSELTYEQLKEYLFVPYSNQSYGDMLEGELSRENLSTLSKEDIVEIINDCRSVSLWDRLFGEYKQFENFKEKIDELQPYRNSVMHHKRVTLAEYESLRKKLKKVNCLLVEAINVLEEDIYTETELVDVVSALGNMLSNVLGNSVSKWIENMKSALATFGKVLIEAAMPKINVFDIMPKVDFGEKMARTFARVYDVPQVEIPIAQRIATEQKRYVSSMVGVSGVESVMALYDNAGINMAYEMAAETEKIKSMCRFPELENMRAIAASVHSTGQAYARQWEEQYRRLTEDFAVMSPIESTVVSLGDFDGLVEIVPDDEEDDENT